MWDNVGRRKEVHLQMSCCQKMPFLKTAIRTKPFTLALCSLFGRVCVDTSRRATFRDGGHGEEAYSCHSRRFHTFCEVIPIGGHNSRTCFVSPIRLIWNLWHTFSIFRRQWHPVRKPASVRVLRNSWDWRRETHPYSKEGNGIVKRANKKVNRTYNKLYLPARSSKSWMYTYSWSNG